MPFLFQNIDSIIDFLWDVDNFIFFELVSPGNFHSIDPRFDSGMNNKTRVSSIVMIFERSASAIRSKMDNFFGSTSNDEPASQLLKALEQNCLLYTSPSPRD